MANEIKKTKAISVGPDANRQAQKLAVQAAELGVNVVQYLFAPEGAAKLALESLIADQATSLKTALLEWDSLFDDGTSKKDTLPDDGA